MTCFGERNALLPIPSLPFNQVSFCCADIPHYLLLASPSIASLIMRLFIRCTIACYLGDLGYLPARDLL